MKKPLVSILICTYNAEKTITNTLKSCLDQTYDNFEILIHDDQSKDRTIAVINSIGDRRIKIIKSGKKLGPYAGLNFLLDNAKGEYIAIQDHDDIWHPEKLKEQIKFLEENKNYVGCGTGCLQYFEGSKSGFFYDTTGGDTYYVTHPSLVFRNQGYRYNTKMDYIADAYFQRKILSNDVKSLYVIPYLYTLHYVKGSGENYSESWFNLSAEKIKRFFEVHGFGFHSIISFSYILLKYFIGKSFGKNIDSVLLQKRYRLKKINVLKKDKDANVLLSYLA